MLLKVTTSSASLHSPSCVNRHAPGITCPQSLAPSLSSLFYIALIVCFSLFASSAAWYRVAKGHLSSYLPHFHFDSVNFRTHSAQLHSSSVHIFLHPLSCASHHMATVTRVLAETLHSMSFPPFYITRWLSTMLLTATVFVLLSHSSSRGLRHASTLMDSL